MIQIRNGKRFNVYAGGEIDGVTYPNFRDRTQWAALGISEVPEPAPPADYDDMKYQRVESDDAPYLAYVERTTEEKQAIRWTRIVQIREELTLNGGCLVSGKWFHTDVHSKQQQMALVMLGESLPADLWWKTMDGSFITMTPTLAQQLFAAQVAREQSIFAIAEAKRLDDSPLDDGWPDRYEPAQPEPVE